MSDLDDEPFSAFQVVVITPTGDATIIAKNSNSTTHFLVSSQAFALVCEPWNSMVKYRATMGPFASSSRIEFVLEDDDTTALETVLHIAHMHFDKIPSAMSLSDMFALSTLTDKYQATRIVGPWIPRWLPKGWRKSDTEASRERVWVAWEYGMVEDFEALARILVLDTETCGESTLLYQGTSIFEHMPPGLVDAVLKARDLALTSLFFIFEPYFDSCFKKGDAFRFCQRNIEACDAAICGSIILGLQSLDLYPLPDPSAIGLSVSSFAAALTSLKIHNRIQDHNYPHNRCNFAGSLRGTIAAFLANNVESAVTRAHYTHFEHQKALLNIPE